LKNETNFTKDVNTTRWITEKEELGETPSASRPAMPSSRILPRGKKDSSMKGRRGSESHQRSMTKEGGNKHHQRKNKRQHEKKKESSSPPELNGIGGGGKTGSNWGERRDNLAGKEVSAQSPQRTDNYRENFTRPRDGKESKKKKKNPQKGRNHQREGKRGRNDEVGGGGMFFCASGR